METGKRKGSSLHKGSQAEDSETAMVDTGTAGEERERHGGCTQWGGPPPRAVGAGVRTGDVLCRGRGLSVRQTADAHSGEQRGFAEQGKHRNKGSKRPGRSFPAPHPPPRPLPVPLGFFCLAYILKCLLDYYTHSFPSKPLPGNEVSFHSL